MKISTILLTGLVAVAFFTVGCGGGQTTTSSGNGPGIVNKVEFSGGVYWELTASQLYSLIQEEDVFLIQYDLVNTGQIPGTKLFVSNISSNAAQLPPDKSTPVVVYCHAGIRSPQAARELVELGYYRVYDLVGGTAAWSNQGYPLFGG
ncbi:MAG: rhodanese-like domain-containing protein [Dehalococcoidaceae bacterium]|nr:rhodanese-like domain-containing protein [Dehalococcoidaceae bacterium]